MAVHSYSSFEVNRLFMSFEIHAKRFNITSLFEFKVFTGNQAFPALTVCLLLYCCISKSKETKMKPTAQKQSVNSTYQL